MFVCKSQHRDAWRTSKRRSLALARGLFPPCHSRFAILDGHSQSQAAQALQMSLQTQPEPTKNHTILVVEDEMLLRLDLAHQLRGAGFEVVEADSGDEALAILKAKGDVDLILTDIRMPEEIDGAGLARSVRGQTQNIKIVILSAYIDTQQELPVDATFTKPVRIEALLAKVRQLLPPASAHF